MWLGARIGQYRRAAKVAHPNVYVSAETIASAASAEEKRALYLFNCAQRAHHNILENYPTALTGMLITGIKYPILASALGIVWISGRILYAFGYTSTSEKNINGRGRFFHGGFHMSAIGQFGFVVLVGKIGIDLLRE